MPDAADAKESYSASEDDYDSDSDSSEKGSVVLHCNFRSLAFSGFLGFLARQLKKHSQEGVHIKVDHGQSFSGALSALFGLCLHSLVEGTAAGSQEYPELYPFAPFLRSGFPFIKKESNPPQKKGTLTVRCFLGYQGSQESGADFDSTFVAIIAHKGFATFSAGSLMLGAVSNPVWWALMVARLAPGRFCIHFPLLGSRGSHIQEYFFRGFWGGHPRYFWH